MEILLLAFFGVAVFGGDFFKLSAWGVTVLDALIFASAIYYTCSCLVFYRRRTRCFGGVKSDRVLWAFFAVGCVVVALSYLGVYRAMPRLNLLVDSAYIPRQAYYLFFLPLVILAGRERRFVEVVDWARRNSKPLFFAFYVAYVVANRAVALQVPITLCLGVLLLLDRRRERVLDLMCLALIVFSPIGVGGELTQAIIRLLVLVFYFATDGAQAARFCLGGLLLVVLACFVIPYLPLADYGWEANSVWRAEYWADELGQLASSWGMGVGYGTSYATSAFVGEAVSGPFAEDSVYSVSEKLFVVGCHNSFVSVSFRLGVFGVLLLITFFSAMRSEAADSGKRLSPAGGFAVSAAMAVICFNVGLESPMYFFAFAFAVALFHVCCHTAANERASIWPGLEATREVAC